MEFKSDRIALTTIAEVIVKSGVNLFNTIKHIYALADEDFYNCDIKDLLKVVLNNVTDIKALDNMGLRINNFKCAEMNSPEYDRVLSLIVYSFAVRIPTLKRIKARGKVLSDSQLKKIYEIVVSKGAANYEDAIPISYNGIRRMVRSGKEIPPYNADWYKTYIYQYVPAVSTITNKNIYLLGVVDILFTLFYSCVEEELRSVVEEFGNG